MSDTQRFREQPKMLGLLKTTTCCLIQATSNFPLTSWTRGQFNPRNWK